MKIINEKGKLFGLINLADLIIVIVVVLLVGAIIWQLAGDKVQDTVAKRVEVQAELVVEDVTPELIEEVYRQELIDQNLVSGSAYLPAKVIDIWVEDREEMIITDDGEIIKIDNPYNQDIHFMITTTVADSASFKIGTQEVKIGSTVILKTQTFESEAQVVAIDVIDKE